jgi:hypothetical protein
MSGREVGGVGMLNVTVKVGVGRCENFKPSLEPTRVYGFLWK